ncbi:MAG: ABC transporter permease, partial [Muribaculaceae bacterium]|nr:ABC transporter permease [Muribaculaceae bacterium]
MFDLINEIGQAMRNNKLRTGLTGFAVAWGIFMLIILLGLSHGLVSGFEKQSGKRDNNRIAVWQGSTSMPYKGYNKNRKITLKASTVEALNESGNKYIRKASASKNISAATVTGPEDYIASGVTGVTPETRRNQWVEMVKGRFINDADI